MAGLCEAAMNLSSLKATCCMWSCIVCGMGQGRGVIDENLVDVAVSIRLPFSTITNSVRAFRWRCRLTPSAGLHRMASLQTICTLHTAFPTIWGFQGEPKLIREQHTSVQSFGHADEQTEDSRLGAVWSDLVP
ncbi:hypothetical protein ANN_24692 [Periplaneta americana]|uniref:Uncharacterized protein n=1 Tax=Periplaneta americana TaxID=6978 RepID=A0ABQ8RZA6_PERAM|nr:hypothetical protein ANN_24692 [Periplaneta americana]